jgi:hypothetical protein
LGKSDVTSSNGLFSLEEEIIRLLKENNQIQKAQLALLENINENVRRIKANTS